MLQNNRNTLIVQSIPLIQQSYFHLFIKLYPLMHLVKDEVTTDLIYEVGTVQAIHLISFLLAGQSVNQSK